jgi:hypothetical protein
MDIPGPGHLLGTAAERLALRFRSAAASIASGSDQGLAHAYAEAFGARDQALSQLSAEGSDRAAWGLLGVWAVARIALQTPSCKLHDAEDWFFGDADRRLLGHVSPIAQAEAEKAVEGLEIATLSDLLPYAIDPHGPGTRRSVIRDPSQQGAQAAKRKTGIYYTPGDAADFMTQWVLDGDVPRLLDPACGTGVFLRSAARHLSRALPSDQVLARLYGIDLDPLALEATCFVLTAALASPSPDYAPIRLWHLARLNLAQRDTLSILLADDGLWRLNAHQRTKLVDGRERLRTAIATRLTMPAPVELDRGGQPETFSTLFPEADAGFAVVGNPPYSPLGPRRDIDAFRKRRGGVGGRAVSASTNAFLPFLELMWRLTNGKARAALVVPLSVAYNTTQPFQVVRGAMASTGGTWTMRFFDRTPDALFGDDIKQRAAIVLREPTDGFRLRTSGLMRWSSRQRGSLFHALPDPIDLRNISIARGIPKVGSEWESELYFGLAHRNARLSRTLSDVSGKRRPKEASANLLSVGATAYNWLVLYRGEATAGAVTSRLFVADEPNQADWAYALLSSGLVYWLWRVDGDGFHVPARWLNVLPFEWDGTTDSARIADHGRRAWELARHQPVQAVNSGRRTVSFRPDLTTEVPAIDRLLLGQLGMDPDLEEHLSQFRQAAISVGRESES